MLGGEEEEERCEPWDAWDEDVSLSRVKGRSCKETKELKSNGRGSRLLLSTSSQVGGAEPVLLVLQVLNHDPVLCQDQELDRLQDSLRRPPPSSETVRLQQQSRDLQDRLMVSEDTVLVQVQVQAEQLRDYRDLLSESSRPHACPHTCPHHVH